MDSGVGDSGGWVFGSDRMEWAEYYVDQKQRRYEGSGHSIVHGRKGVIWVYGPIRNSRAGTTISCFLRTVAFVMVCLV